jgi:ferritin-like metal-binding protein YciE
MSQLNEIFLTELADIYHAEGQILKALPKMAKAASTPELKQAFEEHTSQTENQVERLKQVFELFGKPPRGKKCKGIEGIISEGKEQITELEEGPALDAALIAGAQKVEHYEMATYGTLRNWAGLLNNDQAKRLLQETLDEEEITDKKLTELAEARSNVEALVA